MNASEEERDVSQDGPCYAVYMNHVFIFYIC